MMERCQQYILHDNKKYVTSHARDVSRPGKDVSRREQRSSYSHDKDVSNHDNDVSIGENVNSHSSHNSDVRTPDINNNYTVSICNYVENINIRQFPLNTTSLALKGQGLNIRMGFNQ
jgi:hypothetical protein